MKFTAKTLAPLLALLIALAFSAFAIAGPAGATDDEPCVPQAAWTEVIEHPAITEVIHHPAVPPVTQTIPAVAEVWANWSPNRQQGPFEGPPAYPTDPRGTWHIHDKIPGGHEGPDGVYQRDNPGNGRGDWFYRLNGQPEQVIVVTPGTPAYDEVKVIKEAWTETIEHPAVTCPETPTETPTTTPPVVTETPTVTPPTTPEVPAETPQGPEDETPETPQDETPESPETPDAPEGPESHPEPYCLGDALVTETDAGKSIENGHPACERELKRSGVEYHQEGL